MKSISNRKRNLLVSGIVFISLCTPLMASAKGNDNCSYDGSYSQMTGHHNGEQYYDGLRKSSSFSGHHSRKDWDGFHGMDKLRSANFTQEQTKQLQTLWRNYEQKRLPIEANLRSLQLNIRSAVMKTEVQRSTVEGFAQEVAKLQGQLYLLDVSQKLDRRTIVTVVQ